MSEDRIIFCFGSYIHNPVGLEILGGRVNGRDASDSHNWGD